MTDSPWRPEDKAWLAQRKAEWRYVKQNLDILSPRVKKKHQGAHKELFFYGRVDPALVKEDGGEPFMFMLPFFEVWYHPAPAPEVIQQIYDRQTNRHPLRKARDNLFLFYREYWADFPPDYGLMGGREELLVRMLFPSYDHTQVREFRHGLGGQHVEVFPLCWEPRQVFVKCVSDTRHLLYDQRSSRYRPGQYLWDHMAASIEESVFPYENSRENFLILLRYIATYEHQPTFPKHNDWGVALAQKLKNRFEARDFPERLLRYWDEAVAGLDSAGSDA